MKLFAELGYAVVKDRWETRKQENKKARKQKSQTTSKQETKKKEK